MPHVLCGRYSTNYVTTPNLPSESVRMLGSRNCSKYADAALHAVSNGATGSSTELRGNLP